MNVYVVRIPELRDWVEPIMDDGSGPVERYQPIGLFCAEKPSEAKIDALRAWTGMVGSGVFSDDWPALRVRCLQHGIEAPRGEFNGSADETEQLWERVHEVLDHGGRFCDCDLSEPLTTTTAHQPSSPTETDSEVSA